MRMAGRAIMRFFSAALVAWAFANSAFAQEPPPPPAPEQLDAYSASILSAGHADGVFVREPNERVVALRHTASGLRCLFGVGSTGTVEVFPTESLGVAHGDDVGCDQDIGFGKITLYATRSATPITAEGAMATAVAALRALHPEMRAIRVDPSDLPITRPAPPSLTQYFAIRQDGRNVLTRISIAEIDGWVVKMRFTSEVPRADMIAEMTWRGSLIDMIDHRASAASAAPAQPQ